MIKITAKEMVHVLRETPAEQPILFVGRHGIGKSKIIETFFKGDDFHLVTIFLAQNADASDISGYLIHDQTHEKANRLSPEWWPEDGKPIIIFLDELNRANPALHNVVMDLVLNKKLAGKDLPKGSRVISAINLGTEYHVFDLDQALVSRFNIYELMPSVQEWLTYAENRKLDDRIIQFIRQKPSLLDADNIKEEFEKYLADQDMSKYPDRRAWERVSDYIASKPVISDLDYKIISGIVGISGTTQLMEFIRSMETSIGPEDLLKHYSSHYQDVLKRMSIQEVVYLNREVVTWISSYYPELSEQEKKEVRSSLKKVIQDMQENGQKEALAELINCFEREDCLGFNQLFTDDSSIMGQLILQVSTVSES